MNALLLAVVLTADAGPSDAGTPPPVLDEIRRLAKKAEPTAKSPWVKAFLHAAQALPPAPKLVLFHSADKKTWLTEVEAKKLPEAERAQLVRQEDDDELYYARVADPLGYLRAFDVLAATGFDPKGKKVLDLGYGSIGQLKMLAAIGADVTGIEVHPALPLLYAKENGKQGKGKVTVLHGYFPKDEALVKAAGGGYDLWMSKNTLKKGYVRPDSGTAQIDVGTDEAFLGKVHDMLRPKGLFYIYNFGPAPVPPGKPAIPMADIRCPFSKEALEKAGFEVLAFDVSDDAEGRASAKVLEWDQGPDAFDVEKDLFARYTLARRK